MNNKKYLVSANYICYALLPAPEVAGGLKPRSVCFQRSSPSAWTKCFPQPERTDLLTANGDGFFEHDPGHAFEERRGGQWAGVGPVVQGVRKEAGRIEVREVSTLTLEHKAKTPVKTHYVIRVRGNAGEGDTQKFNLESQKPFFFF